MTKDHIIEFKDWSVYYSNGNYALKNISVAIQPNIVISVAGISHAGKSTLLRSINRLHELCPEVKTSGEIRLNRQNIRLLPVSDLRRKAGMVFRTPNLFSTMNIEDNVTAGYLLNNIRLSKTEKNKIVEDQLRAVGIWEDVKNDLHRKPDFLIVGQKQCLCIARTLALQPEILLMDEPIADLDLLHADKIEHLIHRLKEQMTILVTTRNMTKTARLADYTLYLEDGELVEYNTTSRLLWAPTDERTEKYISTRT